MQTPFISLTTALQSLLCWFLHLNASPSGDASSFGRQFLLLNSDMKTMVHVPYAGDESMVGTSRYSSVNSHTGASLLLPSIRSLHLLNHHHHSILDLTGQSRRDDMESVAYVLLFMLQGTLPWAGTMTNKAAATTNQSKEQRVFSIKSTMPVTEICKEAPRL